MVRAMSRRWCLALGCSAAWLVGGCGPGVRGSLPPEGVDAGSGFVVGDGGVRPAPDAGDDEDPVGDVDGGTPDAGAPDAGSSVVDAGEPEPPLTGCAADLAALGARGGPDGIVTELGAALLPDCTGTRHQTFAGVQRVVFLGDSVTVGTPPADLQNASLSLAGLGTALSDIVSDVDKTYRSRLADVIAAQFGLRAPGAIWRGWNPLAQGSLQPPLNHSGDFWTCARWGSKTDHLADQIDACFPADERDQKTLVVFTIGGNDVVDLVKMSSDGRPEEEIWQRAEQIIGRLEAAVASLKDRQQFPGGNLVLFATPFEFTDWSGDVSSCAAAGASGVRDVDADELFRGIFDYLSVSYLRVAEEQGADVMFLLETFCGHGYRRDDASLPCYRGPDAERFLDLTCIHPNERGHDVIQQRFGALMSGR